MTELLFPTRVAKILKATRPTSFETSEGDRLYGTKITLDNGDHFSHWTPDLGKLERFRKGEKLIYQLKRIIENEDTDQEVVKHKLASYDFLIPRKERFETKIVDVISFVPKEVLRASANTYNRIQPHIWDKELFGEIYNDMYDTIVNAIHNETFERNGSTEDSDK